MTSTESIIERERGDLAESTGKKQRRGRPVGDRDAKRGELLAAGLAVVAELGYAGASLRKVAERAGYTTGAVTYYFANKEEMVVALTEYLFDEFDALLATADLHSSVEEAFQLIFDRVRVDAYLLHAQFQLLAFARVEATCAEVFERRYAAFRQALARIIERQQVNGTVRSDISAELLSDQLSAMSDGWNLLLPVEPKRFSPARIEALLSSVKTLIAPR